MRQALINGRWNLWVPDSIADWDAPTGDAALRSGWEAPRLQSMQENLSWGDCVYDIGTEHGWLAAIIAREFVGPMNMVLMEPSPEFWANIRLTWIHNGFEDPAAVWNGFVGAESFIADSRSLTPPHQWPTSAYGEETGAMAYRSLEHHASLINTTTVDDFISLIGREPTALNIDVEGAEMLVLQGAKKWMNVYDPDVIRHIWVSVHPDLLERDFASSKDQVLQFIQNQGHYGVMWQVEHINTDHEEHWHAWQNQRP